MPRQSVTWLLATQGDAEGVRDRVRGFPEEINKKSGQQFTTPLMQACANNHPAVAKVLLENEHIDITIRDRDNASCFHYAARYSPDSLILLSNGVAIDTEINRPDLSGNTPLHLAAEMGRLLCCQHIVRTGAGDQALFLENYNNQCPDEVAACSDSSNIKTRGYLKTMKQVVEGLHPPDAEARQQTVTNCLKQRLPAFYEVVNMIYHEPTINKIVVVIRTKNPELKNELKEIFTEAGLINDVQLGYGRLLPH